MRKLTSVLFILIVAALLAGCGCGAGDKKDAPTVVDHSRTVDYDNPTMDDLPLLLEQLESDDVSVHNRAVEAIAILLEDYEVIDELFEARQHGDLQERENAEMAFRYMGARRISDALVKALWGNELDVLYRGDIWRSDLGLDAAVAVPVLVEAMQDEDKDIRWDAIDILSLLGTDAAVAVPNVIEALKDPDESIRNSAAKALCHIGGNVSEIAPALLVALEDDYWQIRGHAAQSLVRIDPYNENLPPALTKLLDDEFDSVRWSGANGLVEIGHGSSELVPFYVEQLGDDKTYIHNSAAFYLGMIGPEASDALPDLNEALQTQDANFKEIVQLAIQRIEGNNEGVVDKLIGFLANEDHVIRRDAIIALAVLGPEAIDAIPALAPLLEDEERKVRELAGQAIEKIEGSN